MRVHVCVHACACACYSTVARLLHDCNSSACWKGIKPEGGLADVLFMSCGYVSPYGLNLIG